MESFLVWILESSLFVLLILGIRKIFSGKIRYTALYALWLLVLVRFLIPINFFSTPFSIGNIVSQTVSVWTEEKDTEQIDKTSVRLEQNSYADVAVGHIDTDTLQKAPIKSLPEQQTELEVKGESSDTTGIESGRIWTISENSKRLIFGSWLFVSVTVLLWLIMSNVNLNRKMRKNRLLYGKREGVCIYLVPGIKNPCLYGFFRPVIYLPASFVCDGDGQKQNQEEIGQMIMHEYVHYCHGDHIWAMFRILLVSFYWFDPFLWLAVFCSKKDAELACDETVIQRLGERKRFSYGEMLVRLAADTNWGDFRYSMMAMSRKGKEMEKRIRAISVCKQYSKWILIPLVAAVLVTAGITCSTGIGPLATEPQASDSDSSDRQENQDRIDKLVSKTVTQESMSGDMTSVYTQPLSIGLGTNQFFGSKNTGTDSYEDVFYRYIEYFTAAVNTGNVDRMNQVLAEGSDVYKQQCDLAKNYYKRGIREEIQACSISNVKKMGATMVALESKEKIKVSYADVTSKLIDQTYLYTCEYTNQGWRITRMDESIISPYK